MKPRPIRTPFDLAQYFGLSVELRDDLPASNAGYLDPADEPLYVAINGNLPPCEQMFTVAHEICHYIHHRNRTRRKYRNRVLDHEFKSRLGKIFGRALRHGTGKIVSVEREADMFAVGLLARTGCFKDLWSYFKNHRENRWWCLYAVSLTLNSQPLQCIAQFWLKFLVSKTQS